MSFAGAVFALMRGHKVKRRHWTGYWQMEDGELVIHTHDGRTLNIKETTDIIYTLSNCACDDWEIITEWEDKK